MHNFKKKVLTLSVISSLMAVGAPAIMTGSVLPVIPQVQAYSPLEAIVTGGAAMAYVTKVLGEMDNTDQGQQESLARTKKQTGYYDNAEAQNRVQTILNNLAMSPQVKRKYVVYVNPDKDFNAFMTIGRVMSVNKGALDKLDDDELAYVMAHEISHGEHKDVVSGVKKQIGLSTAISVAAAGTGGGAILGNLVGSYVANQVFTMDQEKNADTLGFSILADSPYNIGGASASMAVLHKVYGDHYREGITQVIAPNNHPKTSDRVTVNESRMAEYSGGHVHVKGSTVFVNGDSIYTPTDSGRYTGEERAYLMAGKLARLYHNHAVAPEWASASGSTVMVGSTSIVSVDSYDAAQNIAATLNTAFGKSVTNENTVVNGKVKDKKATKAKTAKTDSNKTKTQTKDVKTTTTNSTDDGWEPITLTPSQK